MVDGGSSGGATVSLGDRGFLRLNARLEAEQLQAGEVSSSLNGRMDRGSWQPRLAIGNLSGALQADGDPLRLPFFVVDAAGGASIVSAARVGTLVTIEVTSHGFAIGESGYLGIESLTGTVDPNGVRLVTITTANQFTFVISGAVSTETYTGSGKVRSVIDEGAAAAIYGSCVFSDPSSDSDEFIVIAGSGEAYRVALETGATTAISYPTGGTISSDVDLIQAFDRVFLFRSGEQAWEWHGTAGRAITLGSLVSNVATITVADHGLTVGDTVVVSGLGFPTTDPNGTRVVTGVPTASTLTFALPGANQTFTPDADSVCITGFTKVRAGTFVQPQVFEAAGGDVDVVSGLCTVTVVGNATIAAGDQVKVYNSDDPRFLAFIGRLQTVVSATTTSVSFFIPVEDLATIGSFFLAIGKDVSVGSGFAHMPAPPWGAYHQRRLIVPYRFTQSGTTASPVFTDRNIRDELVVSDILDPDVFDTLTNQFRITAGIADFLVGVHPFYDDVALVFMRNSLHGMFSLSGSLSDVSVRELTREIGCLARRSVVQHGRQTLFLSDSGVYSVTFEDEYNLRGVDLPLSDAIQPVIDRINESLAADSVGIYFANRYYLAVPLDSAAGSNDATGNNSVLIYNFLNEGWESVDSVADPRWRIINFHVGSGLDRNRLYVVNNLGGVHQIDAADSDQDDLALEPGEDIESIPVASLLSTRRFDGGSLERKRYSQVQAQIESAVQSCDANFSLSLEDADADVAIGSISLVLGTVLGPDEGASLRVRTGGQRAHGAVVHFEPTEGRPKVKSLRVEASVTNSSVTNQI